MAVYRCYGKLGSYGGLQGLGFPEIRGYRGHMGNICTHIGFPKQGSCLGVLILSNLLGTILGHFGKLLYEIHSRFAT